MATQEELEILLKIQTQNAEAIDKVNAQIKDIEPATAQANQGLMLMAGAAAAAATAVVAAGAAFAHSLSELLNYAEGLEKTNLQTGLSIDFMQKLIKTGDEMGMSWDSTRGSVERMEKALEGNGAALAKFGIDVENFKGLNADEKFRAMAVQIMAIEDPTTRAAAAAAAFGRSGAELIPLLAAIVSGAVDIQRVLGTDTIKSLNDLDKSVDSAKTAWKSLQQEFVASIAQKLPLQEFFASLSGALKMITDQGGPFKLILADWVTGLEFLRTGNMSVALAMREVYLATGRQVEEHKKTNTSVLELTETNRQLKVGLDELVAIWGKEAEAETKAGREVQAAWVKANREISADLADRTREHQRRYQEDADSALKEVDRRLAAEKKLAAEVEKQNREAIADARKKWQQMAQAADAYFDAIDQAGTRSHSQRLSQLEGEAAAAESAYRSMLQSGTATFEELRAAHEAMTVANGKVREEEQKAQILGFENLAHTASAMLRDLFGKHKSAAIAAAIIDTIAAIVKTMSAYPWPWSLIPAAAAAVAGYAEVQKIRQQEAGFAQGTPGTSFLDFGPATPTMLHGEEAVVTRAQGESLAVMLSGAIRDATRSNGVSMAAAGGGGPTIVNVYLDGQKIAGHIESRTRTGHMRIDAAGVRRRG